MLVKRVLKNMNNIEDILVELHVQMMLKCLEDIDVSDATLDDLYSYLLESCQ